MNAFFIGLQFLTRIHLVKQTVWTEEDFGKSVRYFPLVGLVLGLVYALAAFCLVEVPKYLDWNFPVHFRAALLAVLPILATGGIHCDGFMDTVDGIFSGRSRARMLEIMKDSCAGSFGVVSFGILLLVQYAVLLDMPEEALLPALLVMPVVGRLMMTMAISFFPYARPEGMGLAFAKYASHRVCSIVILYTAVLLALVGGPLGTGAMLASIVLVFLLGRYVQGRLGGLTGDVYGAICTLGELMVLVFYLFAASLPA